jgi:hypothetical protein
MIVDAAQGTVERSVGAAVVNEPASSVPVNAVLIAAAVKEPARGTMAVAAGISNDLACVVDPVGVGAVVAKG